jgi:hypothetical protein
MHLCVLIHNPKRKNIDTHLKPLLQSQAAPDAEGHGLHGRRDAVELELERGATRAPREGICVQVSAGRNMGTKYGGRSMGEKYGGEVWGRSMGAKYGGEIYVFGRSEMNDGSAAVRVQMDGTRNVSVKIDSGITNA